MDARMSIWRTHLVALVALLLILLWLYRNTAMGMVGIWMRSDTFAHAFVVPPISLWLIWRTRADVADETPLPSVWVALVLLVFAMGWALGELVTSNAATQLMFTAMLVTAVPAVLGWKVSQRIAFPLGFLFFAVPIGEFLTPLLMQYTADFVVLALRLTGIPVYREGQHLVIPTGHWSVVEACSGIRYLMASLMAGTLFAYLNFASTWRRFAFVAISIMVPIVANWLRAYIIVMLGHLSSNRIATGVDHLVYGWLFFGIVIIVMFYFGGKWAASVQEDEADAKAASATLPSQSKASFTRLLGALVACSSAVMVPPSLLAREFTVVNAHPVQLQLGERWATGWSQIEGGQFHALDWRPQFQLPSAEVRRLVAAGSNHVGVYMAYYRGQNSARKLVSSENMLVKSEDPTWNRLSSGIQTLNTASRTYKVRSSLLAPVPGSTAAEGTRLRVWQFYWVDGHYTASDVEAKLRQARRQISGRGDDGAAIVLHAIEDPANSAEARLTTFLSANADTLDAALRSAERSQ